MINPILNKGGFGKSYSRQETVKRINPLVQAHHNLIFASLYAVEHLTDKEIASALDALQPTSRIDVGKLMEVVFSNGGTPPNGTDLEVEAFKLGDTDQEIVQKLTEMEAAYQRQVKQEFDDKNHQIRTLAVLENVLHHAEERLRTLKQYARVVTSHS